MATDRIPKVGEVWRFFGGFARWRVIAVIADPEREENTYVAAVHESHVLAPSLTSLELFVRNGEPPTHEGGPSDG